MTLKSYTFEQETAVFHSITPPSQLELDSLLKTIAQRIVKLLEKRSLIVKDQTEGDKFRALAYLKRTQRLYFP